jgi:hypothetical protein
MGPPIPGPYGWKFHPWVREILDSKAPFNYAMKAAQLGVTEVAINRALYVLDVEHRDVLYVLPTQKNASDFSKSRFNVALYLSPYLKQMFTETDSIEIKRAGANTLYIRGSRGDSNLKSIPVSDVILDEMDEMEPKAVRLAMDRLAGQFEKHVWAISTPTLPNVGIHKGFLTSTQEHFMFKCPHCGKITELVWPDCIEITGDSYYDVKCKNSFLKCKECKQKLEHKEKAEWLAEGKWVRTNFNCDDGVRGFAINQMYSFTRSPAELAVESLMSTGDEAAQTVFNTSCIGQPFIGDGAQITDDMLERCLRKKYTTNDRRPEPGKETRLITMGVDQGKIGYISIVEWFVPGRVADVVAASMGKLLWYGKFGGEEEEWKRLDELMREWQVLACVVDADPFTNDARRFAKRFWGYVWLTRYRDGNSAREMTIVEKDVAPIAQVDRSNWFSSTLGRFKSDPPRIMLPTDVSQEYLEHIKNMVRTYDKDQHGNLQMVYKNLGPDHYAHSLLYAELGLVFATGIQGNDDLVD